MARDRAGNSIRKAREVSLNKRRSVFRDAVNGSDKNDFYQFRIGGSSRLSVSLSKLKANADITLLNQNKSIIGRSRRRGRRAEKLVTNLEAGTYFVHVSRRQGSTRYRLKLKAKASASGASTAAASSLTPAVKGASGPNSAPTAPSPRSSSPSRPTSTPSAANPLVQEVLTLTNTARQEAGLAPLRLSETLSGVARSHSENMAIQDFFGHVDPSGSRSQDRVSAANYGYRATAENIGAGYSTAEGIFEGWFDSPSHRANILSPRLTEIGIGYHRLDNDTGSVNYNHYWTQVFGNPLF